MRCSLAAFVATLVATVGPTFGQSITLVQLSTNFNSPVGIDYHEPTNSLIMSVNYPSGLPNNLERIEFDGSNNAFSSLAGQTDELKVATVRSIGNPGAFVIGDVFIGNGNDGEIVRVTNGGNTILNPWVSLPGLNNGLFRGSFYIDRAGVVGGDLVAATTNGEVWRIDNAGVPTLIADVNVHLEGLITVPNDPVKWGPIAGKIIAGAEDQGLMFIIDPNGTVSSVNLGVAIEDIDIVLPNEAFYGVNFGTSRLLAAPASEFQSIVGDILLTQEFPNGAGQTGLYRLFWNGASLQTTQLTLSALSLVPGQWEHVTFAPLGVAPFPSCEINPPGPFTAIVGQPIQFTVMGSDVNPADMVTLTATGLPPSATLNPPLPQTGNPVSTMFSWTPMNGDVGDHTILFKVIDSFGLETVCEVMISVTECYLYVGISPTSQPVHEPNDLLFVQPLVVIPVTQETMPVFQIPNDPSLIGLHLYSQVGMHNPSVYPNDPIQMSNGLDIVISGSSAAYGQGSGITQWLHFPAKIGGSLHIKFAIGQ